MDYTLSMIFLTETGEKSTISLSGVRGDITDAEAAALMDIYIAQDIFINAKGALVSKYDAKLTERTVTDFTV